VLRVLLIPIILIGDLSVAHPRDRSGGFGLILAGGAVYALVLLVVHVASWRRRGGRLDALRRVEPFVDLALICALVYTSGGPFAQARVAFFALPLIAAFRLRPRLTALWAAVAVVAYTGVSLSHPALHDRDAPGQVLAGALYLAWAGLAAIVLSSQLAARTERIRRLADERRSLVRQALESESRERRRLAADLHDNAVQTLLLAGQELQQARRDEPGALDRAETALRMSIAQLRSEISDLHSHVLDHAGLEAALEDLAKRWSASTGIPVTAHVDPEATGRHDELVFAAARELVANAARHASARSIDIALDAGDGQIELRVSDDGVGMAPAARGEAVARGHIGLATTTERVEALGGRFEVRSSPGHGTTAVTTVPDRR
jgi:two-component system NarL family sensor kinase